MSVLRVDTTSGKCYWEVPPRYHPELRGTEAGSIRKGSRRPQEKGYCFIKIGGKPFKRAYLVFAIANGRFPSEQIDHSNGDSTDDRASNLREATLTQNIWNQRTHRKRSPLPRGVRKTVNGKFEVRLRKNGQTTHRRFTECAEAEKFYLALRSEAFGEYSGVQS